MEQELKFEKALERLESIVEDLESGEIPLDDALKRYEEGVKLARFLGQKLTQVETKIEVLTRALSGQADPAITGGETEPKKSERKKGKRAAKNEENDDSLFL